MTALLGHPVRVTSAIGTSPTKQILGVYQGSVVNINDPLRLGRVQVTVPQILGTAVSNWASPLGNSSLVSSVILSQYVYVMFIGGDLNQPVYLPQNWSASSNLTLPGTLTVTGSATLHGGLTVTGGATIDIINSSLSVIKANSGTARGSVSVTNDPDLQGLPIAANGIYTVEANILNTASGTGNIQYQFSVPAGSTGTYMVTQYNLSSQLQEIMSTSWTTANSAGVNTGTTPVNSSIFIKGLLVAGSSSGTLSFQWGQNTNNGTTTVEQYSYVKAERRQ